MKKGQSSQSFFRRAQLQVMEPIIIVIILAIIGGIGLLFYMRISEGTQSVDKAQALDREDITALQRLAKLRELSCTGAETKDTYCIDKGKAEVFSKMLRDNQQLKLRYNPLFGSSKITLKYYDGSTILSEIIVYDTLKNAAKSRPTRTYFTLYDPAAGERLFAMMEIQRDVG